MSAARISLPENTGQREASRLSWLDTWSGTLAGLALGVIASGSDMALAVAVVAVRFASLVLGGA